MNQSMLFMLAYTLSPQDAERYAMLYPQATGFRNMAQMGDELLPSLQNLSMPDEQKLALSAHLILYSVVIGDPAVDTKLRILLKAIKVSQRFLVKVRKSVCEIRNHLIGDALSIVLRPPEILQQRLSEIVRISIEQGDFHCRKVLTNLSPKEYEHILDRIALSTLQKTPGLDFAMRAVSKHALERMATIAIMGASLRIGPRQFPEIYAMLLETCEVFDMQVVPEFYAEPGGDIFTESLGVENPVIGFSAECLEKIDYEEQVFALGRELGHIKSGHNLYMLLKLVLRNETFMHRILSTIPGIGSAYETMNSALGIALTQWEWSSDYTVDRAGLLCCQDIDVALSCMIKMAGAPEKYYSQINIEAFREQVREFEIHTANLKNKAIKAWLASINKDDDGKIPMWTVTRAHELVKWYESGAYQRVLDRMPFVSEEIPDDDEPEKSFFENLKDKVGLGAGKIDPGNLFCPECGSPNDGVSSFCQQCGKPL